MKCTIAQLNPLIGDIQGNCSKALTAFEQAHKETSDLVVFPELFLVGYPPRDLLEKPAVIEKVLGAVQDLVCASAEYPETGILVGAPLPTGKRRGNGLYNAALLIAGGAVRMIQHKSLLPAYDVFDEQRYFDTADKVRTVRFKGETLGISICEDAWNVNGRHPFLRYDCNPVEKAAEQGATVLINISASPFYAGKEELRYTVMRTHACRYTIPLVFVNQTGGNDELVFDGHSMCIDAGGNPSAVLPGFSEHIRTVDVHAAGSLQAYSPDEETESVYNALVCGLKDYMRKCGFTKAVIGLSGGIDSSVTSVLACRAAEPEHVLGIYMPSVYSSPESGEYAQRLCSNLGNEFLEVPIDRLYSAYISDLNPHLHFTDEVDTVQQNIQARIRGNILMAFSNHYGSILLSTGNKSELSVGYCTLYGDMSGGLAVISDVPKTMVYKLARYINEKREIIPEEVLSRTPSAELAPDQKDRDTLPPYDILDTVLNYYIEENASADEIIQRGYDHDMVRWITDTVNCNEYKRRQAPPGLKVTSKAFGPGRRMPVAPTYRI